MAGAKFRLSSLRASTHPLPWVFLKFILGHCIRNTQFLELLNIYFWRWRLGIYIILTCFLWKFSCTQVQSTLSVQSSGRSPLTPYLFPRQMQLMEHLMSAVFPQGSVRLGRSHVLSSSPWAGEWQPPWRSGHGAVQAALASVGPSPQALPYRRTRCCPTLVKQ